MVYPKNALAIAKWNLCKPTTIGTIFCDWESYSDYADFMSIDSLNFGLSIRFGLCTYSVYSVFGLDMFHYVIR